MSKIFFINLNLYKTRDPYTIPNIKKEESKVDKKGDEIRLREEGGGRREEVESGTR